MLVILQGGFVFLRGIIGNKMVGAHQFIMVVQVILSLCFITLLITLYYNPSTIPFYVFDESAGIFVNTSLPFDERLVRLTIVAIIALTIINALTDVFKAGKLEKYKSK